MGNRISYSSDDEFLRITLDLSQNNELKKQVIYDLKSFEYIQLSSFQIDTLSLDLILLKIHVNDLEKFLNLKSFKNALEFLGTTSSKASNVIYFGFGLENHSEILSSFYYNFEESFVFNKEKQIKHIVNSINRLLELEESHFYSFTNNVPLTALQRIPQNVEIQRKYYNTKEILGSYLLVNIKGGVGYFHIDENTIFKRVGGSIIGESTFKALSKLMTNFSNSEDAYKSAISGNNTKIDMTVEDIYGDKLTNLGLSKDIIASSFGKAVVDKSKLSYSENDLARSLVTMIAINIGQMSWLYSEIERLNNIIVVGSKFVGDEFYFMFQSVINAYSKFQRKVIFVENSDFLATLSPVLKEF